MHPSTRSADPTADQNVPQGPPGSGDQSYNRFPTRHKPRGACPGRGVNTPAGGALKTPGLGAKGAMEHPRASVTILPPAGRKEQMERWGITPDRLGDHLFQGDRRGHGPDDAVRTSDESWDDPDQAERDLEERGFILEGGWHAVSIKGGEEEGGVTSHRGVLHPGEYFDEEALRGMVERELGFTYEQVCSVYRQGPLSADQRELRGRIDARLLALSRAGGNLTELGRALGFYVDDYGNCDVVKAAVARALKEGI